MKTCVVKFSDEDGVLRAWGTGINELQAEHNAMAEWLAWRKANPHYRGEGTKELTIIETTAIRHKMESGFIEGGLLQGARGKIVRQSERSGSITVKLDEDCEPYKS